jgi:hypothetical protein
MKRGLGMLSRIYIKSKGRFERLARAKHEFICA